VINLRFEPERDFGAGTVMMQQHRLSLNKAYDISKTTSSANHTQAKTSIMIVVRYCQPGHSVLLNTKYSSRLHALFTQSRVC